MCSHDISTVLRTCKVTLSIAPAPVWGSTKKNAKLKELHPRNATEIQDEADEVKRTWIIGPKGKKKSNVPNC